MKSMFRPLLPMERAILRYVVAPAILLIGVGAGLVCHSLLAPLIAIGVAAFYVFLGRTPSSSGTQD